MVEFISNLSKGHRTDRFRGGRQWVERWTNAKAGFIGFLTGRGYSSDAIAEELADGTSAATIRAMSREWGLRSSADPNDVAFIVIPVTMKQRANIHARAEQNGLGAEEYARQLLVCGSMPVDRFREIVPEGQF